MRLVLDLVEYLVGESRVGALLRINQIQLLVILIYDQLIWLCIHSLFLLGLIILACLICIRIGAADCVLCLFLAKLSLHSPRRSLLEYWRSVLLVRCLALVALRLLIWWSQACHGARPLLRTGIPHGELLRFNGLLLLLLEKQFLLFVVSLLKASGEDGDLSEEGIRGVHEDAGAGLLAQRVGLRGRICLHFCMLGTLLLIGADLREHVLRQRQLQELQDALGC